MPNFRYTILAPDGKEASDVILAANASEAAAKLKSGGRFVLSVEPLDIDADGKVLSADLNIESFLALIQPAKRKDTVMLFRQLAVLLDAGIGIVQALSILERQAGKHGLKRLLRRLRLDVEAGENLSETMSRRPKVFSKYVISMIRAGEMSGEMELSLNRIADRLESSAAFKRQMITSMIYPAIVVLMTVGVVGILTLVVIPKFKPLLGATSRSLPPATQFLMDVSTWAQIYWRYVLFGVVAAVLIAVGLRKTEEGGHAVDALLLRVPLIGGILRNGVVVNFSRNMSTLFASGVSLVDALPIVRDTLGNKSAAKVMDKVALSIMEGENMSEPLRRANAIFPPMVAEMVGTGEETGEIEKIFNLTADIYQKTLEANVKRMNALIEPLLILILGGIVGFVFYGLISGMLAVYGL